MRRLIACVAVAVAALSSGWIMADAYKVDPVHSTIVFRIGHLQVSHVNGRLNDPTGTIEFDPANLEKTSFDVQVDVKKVDTANQQRDTHLRSKDFFEAETYPTVSFKSTSAKKTGEGELEVAGNLTLHGVTKPITVKMTSKGPVTDPKMGTRAGFATTLTIKRSDYGMTTMIPAVGDEVTLTIDLEAVKQ